MLFTSLALMVSAVGASAQQTDVDIVVTSASFANGALNGMIARKDPPFEKLNPEVKVRVSVGLKGQKPAWSTDIVLKTGGSQSVSAPWSGSTSNVTLTMSAIALDLKENQPTDN